GRVYRHFYPRSPRGERQAASAWLHPWPDFYPRSPRGERQRVTKSTSRALVVFLSTLPARGATRPNKFYSAYIEFLSTLPARGATQTFAGDAPALKISIHAPREGSDQDANGNWHWTRD